jgi:hypothetical protein
MLSIIAALDATRSIALPPPNQGGSIAKTRFFPAFSHRSRSSFPIRPGTNPVLSRRHQHTPRHAGTHSLAAAAPPYIASGNNGVIEESIFLARNGGTITGEGTTLERLTIEVTGFGTQVLNAKGQNSLISMTNTDLDLTLNLEP